VLVPVDPLYIPLRLSSEMPTIGRDSNPNQRTQNLFELRPFRLDRVLPTESFSRLPSRLIGPPDEELRALAVKGLTLRAIAERVGMSAEGVRWRLRRAPTIIG
jgi:hypothetical protein